MARSDLILWIALVYSCAKYAELCSVKRTQDCENYSYLSAMTFHAFVPTKNFNAICKSLVAALDCVYEKGELDKCPLEIRFPFDTQRGVIQAVCVDRRQEYVSSGPCLQQDSLETKITLEYLTAIQKKETDICRTLDQLPDSVRDIVQMTDGCGLKEANLMADLMRLYLVPATQKAGCDRKFVSTAGNNQHYQKQESVRQEHTRKHQTELAPTYRQAGGQAENKDSHRTDAVDRRTDLSRQQTSVGQAESEKKPNEENPRLTSASTTGDSDMTWADQGESSSGGAAEAVSPKRSHGGKMEAQFINTTSIRIQETSSMSANLTNTSEEARIRIEETPIIRVSVHPTKEISVKMNYSYNGSDLLNLSTTQETFEFKVKASAMKSTQSNSATGRLNVNLMCLLGGYLTKAFIDSVTKNVPV